MENEKKNPVINCNRNAKKSCTKVTQFCLRVRIGGWEGLKVHRSLNLLMTTVVSPAFGTKDLACTEELVTSFQLLLSHATLAVDEVRLYVFDVQNTKQFAEFSLLLPSLLHNPTWLSVS